MSSCRASQLEGVELNDVEADTLADTVELNDDDEDTLADPAEAPDVAADVQRQSSAATYEDSVNPRKATGKSVNIPQGILF